MEYLIGLETDFIPQTMRPFHLVGIDLVVFCDRSRNFSALEDKCSHEDVPLSEGDYDNGTVTCWAHGAKFDTNSGRHLCLPAVQGVKSFEICVREGKVFVNIP